MTGHSGFKGGWLSLWLEQLGTEVHGLSLPPDTEPNLFALARVADGIHSRFADLCEQRAVLDIVAEVRPEVVFHLAAQPLVRRSYEEPLLTFQTNVMGTANLLDAVRKVGGVRAVVVVTTDKCYENREWVWPYRENEALGGYDPYSSSKACSELVAASYRQSYFTSARYSEHRTALATARAGNVIGGGDWAADRLIPDIVRAFADGQKVQIRNPESVRPWQHVLESLSGYLLLAQSLLENGVRDAEAFNFGPFDADTLPVRDVVEIMAHRWGDRSGWSSDGRPRPHEAQQLRLDSSKARSRLSWQPRLSIADALTWTVDWYQSVLKGADARGLTLEQIERYARKGEHTTC